MTFEFDLLTFEEFLETIAVFWRIFKLRRIVIYERKRLKKLHVKTFALKSGILIVSPLDSRQKANWCSIFF